MFNKKNSTIKLARAGVIAALYTATSFIVAPVASGAIQLRLSEALTLLPLIFAESVPALFIGCILSNLITGCALYDVIFGSLITLVAAIFTFFTSKLIKNFALKVVVGGLFPVILNALLLPIVWWFCYKTGEYVYLVQVLFLFLGQAVSVYLVGTPLLVAVDKKMKKFK